ncbi:hypothetical protein FJTKL_08286 [Diaporthe vaccinii]|uniref:Uncharacterized protein n=1 Tax=Diaporthe vaccinii TaxID=105482 RepID=A0ABR4ESE9_9PEZI
MSQCRFRLQPAPSASPAPASPAQPNSSSSSAQASFITRGTIHTSITSNPNTHRIPYGILTSSSFRQSSPRSAPTDVHSLQAQTVNLPTREPVQVDHEILSHPTTSATDYRRAASLSRNE